MIANPAPPPALVAPLRSAGDTASSPEAQRLREQWNRIGEHFRQRTAFGDLDALWREAAKPGWAGRNGESLMPGAYWKAQSFLQAALLLAAPPELTVDNDGEVVMDWTLDRTHLLSIGIAANGRLLVTFRNGDREGTFTDWFRGAIPASVAQEIVAISTVRL